MLASLKSNNIDLNGNTTILQRTGQVHLPFAYVFGGGIMSRNAASLIVFLFVYCLSPYASATGDTQDSQFVFRKTEWNSSLEEVKAEEKNRSDSTLISCQELLENAMLVYKMTIYDSEVTVFYSFINKTLDDVMVIIDKPAFGCTNMKDTLSALKKALDKRYGETTWDYLVIPSTIWVTPYKVITLIGVGPSMTIYYNKPKPSDPEPLEIRGTGEYCDNL